MPSTSQSSILIKMKEGGRENSTGNWETQSYWGQQDWQNGICLVYLDKNIIVILGETLFPYKPPNKNWRVWINNKKINFKRIKAYFTRQKSLYCLRPYFQVEWQIVLYGNDHFKQVLS